MAGRFCAYIALFNRDLQDAHNRAQKTKYRSKLPK